MSTKAERRRFANLLRARAERFHLKVDRSGGVNACHPWLGARWHRKGTPRSEDYGSFRVGDCVLPAHRVAYLLAYLESHPEITEVSLDSETQIRHRCDTRLCCNSRHLIPGSQTANMADMRSRGRDNHWRKLSDKHIRMVRSLADKYSYRSVVEAMAEAGVSISAEMVGRIARGEAHKEVP